MLANNIKKLNRIKLIQETEKKKKQKKFNLKLLSKINLNYLPRNSELSLSPKFVICPLKNNTYGGKACRYRGFRNTTSSTTTAATTTGKPLYVDYLIGKEKRKPFYNQDEEDHEDQEIYSLIHINDIYHQYMEKRSDAIAKDLSHDLKYKYGICLNHKDPITAVTMSSSIVDSCTFFISCSRSKLIISLINVVNLELIHEEVIETGFGEVDWVTIDKSDQWIAMGVDRDIYVIEWSTMKIIKLEGHQERVTNVLFFYTLADPSQNYQSFLCLLSLSEDRTFIIWDFQNECCIYQSEILSPLPLTSVVIDQNRCRVIIGGMDGRLRFYDLNTLRTKMICEPRCIHITDLSSYWKDTVEQDLDDLGKNNNKNEGKAIDINVVSSLPKWRSTVKGEDDSDLDTKKRDSCNIDYGSENPILNIHFLPQSFSIKKSIHSKFQDSFSNKKFTSSSSSSTSSSSSSSSPLSSSSISQEKIKSKSSYLLVGTTQGIIILDSDNYNILYHYNLHEIPLCRVPNRENSSSSLPSSSSSSLAQNQVEYSMTLVDGYHFLNFANTTLITLSHRFNQSMDILELSLGQDSVKQSNIKFTEEEVDALCKDYLNNKIDFQELIYKVTEKNVKGRWSRNVFNDIINEFNDMGISTMEQIKDHIEADFNPKIPKFVLSFIKYFLERLNLLKKNLVSGFGYDHNSSSSNLLLSSESVSSVALTSLYAPKEEKIDPDSPLKWAFIENKLKDDNLKNKKKTTIGGLGVLDIMNQPITFHSHIKSSGYSTVPSSLAYAKNFSNNKSKTKKVIKRPSSASSRTSSTTISTKSLPDIKLKDLKKKKLVRPSSSSSSYNGLRQRSTSSGSTMDKDKDTLSTDDISTSMASLNLNIPNEFKSYDQCKGYFKFRIKYNPDCIQQTGPISTITYNYDGSYIASASTNKTACLYKYRYKPREKGVLYDWNWKYSRELVGHNNAITNIRWGSKCNHEINKLLGGETQLLITSSKDNTARLWSLNKTDPLLVFKYIHGTPKNHHLSTSSSLSSSSSSTNKVSSTHGSIFTYEIKDASLFYQNHFIVLLHHNKLYFYRYLLQKQESGSIKPHSNNNKYKITTSYTTDAQYFTALSCINNNLSHLLLTASSDKSINIYDANVNKSILSIPDASKGKPIHSITLADYETPCSNFHDGFLTCSINDSIRWWDIRTQHNVRVFEGHSRSKYPLKCSISPCGRYISSGSEENGYYIWDVRTSNTLAKVSGGHTDAVMDVDFNPRFAELSTASIDGKVRFFTEID